MIMKFFNSDMLQASDSKFDTNDSTPCIFENRKKLIFANCFDFDFDFGRRSLSIHWVMLKLLEVNNQLVKCCTFWPALGCCALQPLVSNMIFTFFEQKMRKKEKNMRADQLHSLKTILGPRQTSGLHMPILFFTTPKLQTSDFVR